MRRRANVIDGIEHCARSALDDSGEVWALTASDLISVENGHHFHRGWHIGWVWNTDADGRRCLDILSEHRMTNMSARRFFSDGSSEYLQVPWEFRRVGDTPEEDERLKREYFEHNQQAYAVLRKSGLLPPLGANLGSQDINEYLRSGMESGEGS